MIMAALHVASSRPYNTLQLSFWMCGVGNTYIFISCIFGARNFWCGSPVYQRDSFRQHGTFKGHTPGGRTLRAIDERTRTRSVIPPTK